MILRVDACPLHCFYVFLLFPRLAWNDATVGISNKKTTGLSTHRAPAEVHARWKQPTFHIFAARGLAWGRSKDFPNLPLCRIVHPLQRWSWLTRWVSILGRKETWTRTRLNPTQPYARFLSEFAVMQLQKGMMFDFAVDCILEKYWHLLPKVIEDGDKTALLNPNVKFLMALPDLGGLHDINE